jgi:3-isopropylmalate/(R)-2-methylmalate dehydratase small subunit
METKVMGEVLLMGNNIDTDQIFPGSLLAITDPKEIGKLCFSGIDPDIAKKFKQGDIVIAGSNFGCGSSREHAPISLKNMGVSVVLADSFARIFFRNSINLGLPLLVCKGLGSKLINGDKIEVDIEQGSVIIIRTGELINTEKIGEYAMNILKAGGLKQLFKNNTSHKCSSNLEI